VRTVTHAEALLRELNAMIANNRDDEVWKISVIE
jgi:hypothetical protein